MSDKTGYGEPVYWQWRIKKDPWLRSMIFDTQVFATTNDSEVRALYAAPTIPEGLNMRITKDMGAVITATGDGFQINPGDEFVCYRKPAAPKPEE